MRTTRLGMILENAARLSGRTVGTLGVTENQRALAGMALGTGIRRIAAEKFPMMQRIEFRRFRPTWKDNVGWKQGMECWFGDSYWRLSAGMSSGEPGVSPGWTKLKDGEVVAFVAFEQPWENTVIDRAGVDLNRFAYANDPRYFPNAAPMRGCVLNDLGVTILAGATKGVWCRFVPRYPNISFVEWSATTAYEAGDVVYVSSTKDCYEAVADVAAPEGGQGGVAPADDPEHWQVVRVSSDFETYLTKLVAVDLLTEDQGKYQTQASADREFDELCARFAEGIGDGRMRTGRFR